tara:strand:- start:30 stop:530 length:501 start_codon:yes stop_codon:yes gene_type:complete
MRKKLLEFLVPKPKVNKTKLDEAKSGLSKAQQELKGSTAKLKQTQFEIANKLPITFTKTNKKTPSNTELQKAAKARKKEEKEKNFEKVMKDNKKVIKRFFAPENFNKGGRVGLKRGTNLGMQSVKYGLDNKPEVTKLDRIAKFIAKDKKKKNKKFKTPMDKTVRKS